MTGTRHSTTDKTAALPALPLWCPCSERQAPVMPPAAATPGLQSRGLPPWRSAMPTAAAGAKCCTLGMTTPSPRPANFVSTGPISDTRPCTAAHAIAQAVRSTCFDLRHMYPSLAATARPARVSHFSATNGRCLMPEGMAPRRGFRLLVPLELERCASEDAGQRQKNCVTETRTMWTSTGAGLCGTLLAQCTHRQALEQRRTPLARCTPRPAQKQRKTLPARQTSRLAQEQRETLVVPAFSTTSPSNLNTLLDLCVGNLEPKWPRSVVVEWLYYFKRIIFVRWADLSDFFFVDFRRKNVYVLFHVQ